MNALLQKPACYGRPDKSQEKKEDGSSLEQNDDDESYEQVGIMPNFYYFCYMSTRSSMT